MAVTNLTAPTSMQDDAERVMALKELHALGTRIQQLKNVKHAKNDFQRGYLLGLETARMLIELMPAAVLAKIEL